MKVINNRSIDKEEAEALKQKNLKKILIIDNDGHTPVLWSMDLRYFSNKHFDEVWIYGAGYLDTNLRLDYLGTSARIVSEYSRKKLVEIATKSNKELWIFIVSKNVSYTNKWLRVTRQGGV